MTPAVSCKSVDSIRIIKSDPQGVIGLKLQGKIVQNWGHYGSKKINKIGGRMVLNMQKMGAVWFQVVEKLNSTVLP